MSLLTLFGLKSLSVYFICILECLFKLKRKKYVYVELNVRLHFILYCHCAINKEIQEYPLNILTCIFLSTSKTANLLIEIYPNNVLSSLDI